MVEGLVVEMRSFGDNNFVGQRIDGYERSRCLLTTQPFPDTYFDFPVR